ncbi:MAG: hypothetical protein AABX30_02605 [Nanoarchaeota archaeon]
MNPEKTSKIQKQIKIILLTAILTLIGLILFKYLPMYIYGNDILFDASSHVAWMGFGLYVIWFFIDQNKSWRVPYFIFSAVVLIIMGIQRIIAKQHNEIGVLLGLMIIFFAIVIPRYKEIKNKIQF